MAEQPATRSSGRLKYLIGAGVIALAVVALWWWHGLGRESTDDAQVDGHVTQIATRVGGTVLHVNVNDNQRVDAGTVLAEVDPRDYQVALDRAKAELANAEAAATAAHVNVPITSANVSSTLTTAQGGLDQAHGALAAGDKEVQAAEARKNAAHATVRQRQAEANKANRDLDRLKGLIEKQEISQQQYDAAVAAAETARAAADSAQAESMAAESAVAVAQSRLTQLRAAVSQADAALSSARTGPQQVEATRARAAAAAAMVQQARANLAQAELNLQYTVIKAPTAGLVSRKSVEVGQVLQTGQPLMAIVSLGDVWVTANFKETQLTRMRPGQSATVRVDAFPGKSFRAHVDSIAGATGARFSLLPPENATGNFVKVVQRVPVKLVFEPGEDEGHLLRAGMSAVPTVYVR
jgi:membrane fusion protein (multidrug efflux system)